MVILWTLALGFLFALTVLACAFVVVANSGEEDEEDYQ